MKRRLVTLVVFLLLGAIVNVAVAWGCVLGLPPRYHHPAAIDDDQPLASDEATAIMLRAFPDAPIARDESYAVRFGRFGWQQIDAEAMPQRLQPNDDTSVYLGVLQLRAGWPMYGLFGRYQGDGRDPSALAVRHFGLIHVPEWVIGQKQGARRLIAFVPIAPLWPGFAINTLFYAAILWGLFAAPFALRRRRRIKRGLCPKCAYPIGDSPVCTECGKPVAKHKAQTQKAEMS